MKIKNYLKKILIILLFVVSVITPLKVNAFGYMYSSEGKLIEASVGFKVTEEGIFNIQSDAWNVGGANNAGLLAENGADAFNKAADLCLYKDPETGEETIYIVDSGVNKLYIFDTNLRYQGMVSQFKVNPANFTDEELSKMRTRTSGGSGLFWTNETAQSYAQSPETPLYIECNELTGVYRALRPLRDENNVIQLDENEETIYQDILFLCDTKNQQVLLLDSSTYEVIQVVSAPEGVDFADKFQPTKIVSDVTGKMYIISVNIYEGILLMNYNGDFMRMVGVNYTTLSFWDAFKRSQKTDEQLAQETSIIQTIFNNLAIDSKGFLYTVSGAVTNADGTTSNDAMVKRINQSNADVLKRNGYSNPVGDLIYLRTGSGSGVGTSNFVAIAINDYGVYTVVDSRRNRLFTYDNEGNLLYISGGSGKQVTDIANPMAIAYQGDNILILDQGNKCVMRFEPTDFARSINEAVRYEFLGDSENAADQWQNVINANPAYELAYVGVGKKLFEEGRYTEAMLNFEKGSDVKYFSRAYKIYRDDLIAEYFPIVGGILLAALGVSIIFKVVKKVQKKNPKIEDGEL